MPPRPVVCPLALALVLLAPAAQAQAPPAPGRHNGDVLIGERASGPDLGTLPHGLRPLLVTIDTPYEIFDAAGTLVDVTAWAPDGTAASGARVYLANHLVGRTDSHGTLAFQWGVSGADVDDYWLNGSTITVVWDHGHQTHAGQVWFSALARTESFASDHLFVYTDRGLYNPGQTIHLRALGWHLAADWTPLPATPIEVLLTDPDGHGTAGARLTTDDLGTAWTDLPLSPHAAEGLYTLTVSEGDAEATAQLRVERFVPPTIRIDHTLGRFLTRDQADLAFDVTLGTFTGADFTSGTVAVDVLVDGASRFHTSREVTGPGPHHFTVDADTLNAIRGDLYDGQPIQVQIAVDDAEGRHDEVRRDLTYTANPYVAVIEKDRDFYSTGDPVELVVRLTDLQRVPVRDTEVRLETDHDQHLTARTDDSGMAQFTLAMPDEGFCVEVYLPDVATPLATDYIDWQEAQPMRSHIGDAIVSEGAETHVSISFPSHFVPREDVVHLDVVDSSGSLVNAVLVPIHREHGAYLAEGSFEAPSWGSMLLTLFCLGRDSDHHERAGGSETALGLLTEGQNLAVQPNRELHIQLDGVPDEAAPGSELAGRLQVTDAHGNPVDAAVGLALVDQAVISLKDPLEITPMDAFYNPELRVLSTTGSEILTWPVVSRDWGDNQQDVALPPFPFQAGGEIVLPDAVEGGVLAEGEGDELDESTNGSSGEGDVALGDEPEGAYGSYGYGEGAGASGAPMHHEHSSPTLSLMAAPAEVGGLMATGVGEGGGGEGQGTLDLAMDTRAASDDATADDEVRTIITIRTEFPETAVWLPDLRAHGGEASFSGQLPEAITTQELAVVASDGHGGVGVLRQPIAVSQPLWVEVDMPDTLTVGDRVQARVLVHNQSAGPVDARISMAGEGLEVAGGARTVPVDAGGVAAATFDVRATGPGWHGYTATASAQVGDAAGALAARQDAEQRRIWVRPTGVPEVSTQDGSLSAGTPFAADVEVPEDGQMTTLALQVSFPAVSAGYAGLDAIQQELRSGDLMGKGGELMAALLVYQARHATAPPAELEAVRRDIQSALVDIVAAQRPDGGWGFWWDTDSQPYVSAYCLEALMLARELDFSVDDGSLTAAATFLEKALPPSGEPLYDLSAIAFWEGNDAAVRRGITAEVFDILSQLPPELRDTGWSGTMQRLADAFRGELDDDSPDIMAYAHTLLGLHHLVEAGVVMDLTREQLVRAADRLGRLRREGHWEPSWFNAYGGTIEATVAALQVYQALGQDMPEAEARDAVRYLLSTRDEWGGWHNPRGTAAAIRGLLMLAPPEESAQATVHVRVDGTEVRSVAVDPSDPYLSAIALRQLDLTPCVAPGDWGGDAEPLCGGATAGRHHVEVTYDGHLQPQVRLVQRHWGPVQGEPSAAVGLTAQLDPLAVAPGQMARYVLDVRSTTSRTHLVQVDVEAPANAAIDRDSVQALRDAGLIDAYTWQDGSVRLFLQLEGQADRSLALRLEGRTPGVASVPVATAQVLTGEGDSPAAVAAVDQPLQVGL